MSNEIFYLGVVGSKSFTNYRLFETKITEIVNKILKKYKKVIFVSGAAEGADSFAKQYAIENKYKIIEFLPEWRKNGTYDISAAFKRDHLIVNKSDALVAFWDGKSKGTLHSMKLMNIKQLNRLIIVRFDIELKNLETKPLKDL